MSKIHIFIVRLFSVLMLLSLLVSALGVTPARAAGIRYAKPAASGTGDCSNWVNACSLKIALIGAVSGDEIWVVGGMHKPTPGTDRNATFRLVNGVAVYGGFVGTETDRSQRDFITNVTILSGEIGMVDNSDNSYHVVTGASNATLDGFTITAGKTDDVDTNDFGGGMLNYFSNPTLTNVTFNGNSATGSGGGMFNNNSNPTLINVTFSANTAKWGGGIFNIDSSPILTNVTFSNNSTLSYGGGMYNSNSNPTLMNVTFSGNISYGSSGMHNFDSNPTLINVTFSGNLANSGRSGMGNYGSSPVIRNTIFWGNNADSQIYNDTSSVPIVSDSVIQDGYANGTNIITADPNLGTLGNYGGFTQTIPLLPGSSAIDALTNGANGCGTTILTDQRGVTRPQGGGCDIGAFEFGLMVSGNTGVAGATLIYTDGAVRIATADGSGNYFFAVAHNWSGTVTPSKAGFVFSPAKRDYTNVIIDQSAQDYSAYAPKGSVAETMPTYVWTQISGATQYQYQLKKGTSTVYVKTVDSGACGSLTCSNTSPTVLGLGITYKWRVRANVGGTWQAYSPFITFMVKPKPGKWNCIKGCKYPTDLQFYITPDQASVDQFSAIFYLNTCGGKLFKITHSLVPLKGKSFSFTGSFYVNNVTFLSPTRVKGKTGLSNHSFTGCGNQTLGPFDWEAVWRNATQSLAAGLDVEEFPLELLPSGLGLDSVFTVEPAP